MPEASRFWLEIREPGCVPQRKGSWPLGQTAAILREFMAAWPNAYITVVTIGHDGPDFEDGPEALQMADARSMATGTKHIKRTRAAHDALATAVARARREALEEAAKAAERVRDDLYPILNKTRYQDYEVRRYHKHSVSLVVEDIRALAATPPEARQTETGWKPPAGWKLVPEEATQEMVSAAWMKTGDRARYSAMIAAAPPPPAIGNLEGEGRS